MKIQDCGHRPESHTGFSRRDFVRIGGGSVAAYALADGMRPFETVAQSSPPRLDTADACIFIKLAGAMSHMDTFSIKVGAWTPANFNVQTRNGITLSGLLFPNLLNQTNKFSVIHSAQSWVPVHPVAQYWLDTAQEFNAALALERPAMGAVVALEYQGQRRPGIDVFPGFVSLIAQPAVGNGFLNGLVAPFPIAGGAPQAAGRLIPVTGVPGLTHPRGQAAFNRFYTNLSNLDAANRGGASPWGTTVNNYNDFFVAAKDMMYHQDVTQAFTYADAERANYGNTTFGDSLLVARNLVTADKGTRFVHVTFGGWDMHANVYNPTLGLQARCNALDSGLARLLVDLNNTPSPTRPGQNMLQTTMIVMMGEFGRTPPNRYGPTGLNAQNGRDHYANVQFAFVAGGGTRPSRNLGATDAFGSAITRTDFAGGAGRPLPVGPNVRMEDIAVTIYSALNIDWTKEIQDTPSRRVYQYVNGGPNTYYREVRELFV